MEIYPKGYFLGGFYLGYLTKQPPHGGIEGEEGDRSMSDVIERAAQMIAELAEMATALREMTAERDVLRARVAELEVTLDRMVALYESEQDFGEGPANSHRPRWLTDVLSQRGRS